MKKIKKGDIVGRKSYGKDILFTVKDIVKTSKGKMAILRGIIDRIEADSDLEDLEVIEKYIVKEKLNDFEKKLDNRIIETRNWKDEQNYKIGIVTKDVRNREKLIMGKILHLDAECKKINKLKKCLSILHL